MSRDILFIGHSLVGKVMPSMLSSLIPSGTQSLQVDRQVINGAPLAWNWANGAGAEGVNARAVLPSGRYGVVVVTEAIPLDTHLQWSDTLGYAKRYYDLAIAANPAARFYVYETWHSLGGSAADLAAWRQRLDADRAKWAGIVAHINATNGATQPEAMLVPAGAAMAALHDAIAAGRIAGLTSIRQLFADDIHLNETGNYFLTMVQYATLLQTSPQGLSGQTSHEWGSYPAVPAALAQALQALAWTVVQADPSAGVADDAPPPPPPPPPPPEGDVTLTGGAGDDLLQGGNGNDSLDGLGGNDTLDGGAGHDRANGGAGADLIRGGAGADRLFGLDGDDTLQGGDGNDLLYGGAQNDALFGGVGTDQLFGLNGNDRLTGEAGNDLLDGGKGNDTLHGGDGADTLLAGPGNDRLTGGRGADVLTGGDGADVFLFARGDGVDRITDFQPLPGDRLHLARDLLPAGATAAHVVTQFGRIEEGRAVLDFGTGDRVVLEPLATLTGLSDWIVIS
jgi:hypothetical protein